MNTPALPAASICFHCGLPLPSNAAWPVTIDNVERATCCPGCQAVAQAIVANGFADYYRTRTEFSNSGDDRSLVPPELQLYDAPDLIGKFAAISDDATQISESNLSIAGIRCAACVWLIERRLARVPGVLAVHMNVSTERLCVQWGSDRCKPSDILGAVHEIGYAAYPYDAVRHGEQLQAASKKLFRQLFIAGLSMMQVMMYAVPVYLADDGTMDADMANLMRWASLLLTLPAICYSALPFLKGAWLDLRNRALGMDVPVALGISAAFIGSVAATWRGQGEVYFDSITMFIFLLLCSRYLELVARRNAASALEKMHHALPASAHRMSGYPGSRETELVPAAQLRPDDFVLVKPGEAIAADGVIVEGETSIDVSLLTGESRPVPKAVDDLLPGGAVNASQAVIIRLVRSASESTVSALVRLIDRAGQAKPQLAQWADKVAAKFVAALLVFALLTFGFWCWLDVARAWPIAVAVLVVSCPCALSLATPAALAVATDRLLRQGVLIVRSHVIETLHRATHVVFDKTGTLTVGKPSLQQVSSLGCEPETRCLAIAAALEESNAHPLAAAIIEAQRREPKAESTIAATEVRYRNGQGVEGTVDGSRYRLGRAAFVEQLSGPMPPQQPSDGTTSVYLGKEDEWIARFDLADAIRPDAREVVAHFQSRGKKVILLSGDMDSITRRVAASLGIDEVHAEQLPDQKLAFVQSLQRNGAVVAMVGDGINDAAVLRAADVSFAMGAGAALAQAQADTVLLSDRLSAVADTSKIASKTMIVVRQNLFWASVYNALAIPAAAVGLLNPWLSGIGMSLSSALVVVNALRLRGGSRAGHR